MKKKSKSTPKQQAVYVKMKVTSWRTQIQHAFKNDEKKNKGVHDATLFFGGVIATTEQPIKCVMGFNNIQVRPKYENDTITLNYPLTMYAATLNVVQQARELYIVFNPQDEEQVFAYLHTGDVPL